MAKASLTRGIPIHYTRWPVSKKAHTTFMNNLMVQDFLTHKKHFTNSLFKEIRYLKELTYGTVLGRLWAYIIIWKNVKAQHRLTN